MLAEPGRDDCHLGIEWGQSPLRVGRVPGSRRTAAAWARVGGRQARVRALDEALKQLKPVHRRCFVLRHFEKRSYDDIAEIMGVLRNTVGTHLHRARKQLRDILGPLRESPESDPTDTPV